MYVSHFEMRIKFQKIFIKIYITILTVQSAYKQIYHFYTLDRKFFAVAQHILDIYVCLLLGVFIFLFILFPELLNTSTKFPVFVTD